MMKRAPVMSMVVFSLAVFFVMAGSAFAARAQFEEIKKMEEAQKPKIHVERPKAEYKAKGLRDPFQTPFEKKYSAGSGTAPEAWEASLGHLELQGVIWGSSLPQAIVNNRVVKIGDSIEGAIVVDINKYGVVLFLNGKQYTLTSPISQIGPYKESGGVE